jgi:ribosomal protein L15
VVVVLLVVSTTIGMSCAIPPYSGCRFNQASCALRTNFDKYHPGYFGKVGMRRFHLTRNAQWNPTVNVDKLWTLVPEEHKNGLRPDSQVVPVLNVLHHGYSKVLGNGR